MAVDLLTLEWPWALVAGLLPLVVRFGLKMARPLGPEALRFPFFDEVRAGLPPGLAVLPLRGRRGIAWASAIAWACLVLAASRPQAPGEPLGIPLTGRDLMLALDVSSSMQVNDLRYQGSAATRMQVVKRLAGEFVERRLGDRVGLIVFGTRPYLVVPLTFDRAMVRESIQEAIPGLAGERTALGDAIGLGAKHLRSSDAELGGGGRAGARVLVLITDGASTTGRTTPERAAALAAAVGVRIYTVGVGTEISAERQRAMGSRDQGLGLDARTLENVAALSGGRYFEGYGTAPLAEAYALLDRLEPSARPGDVLRPVRELYVWPLAAALSLALAVLAIKAWPFSGLPRRLRGFPAAGPRPR